MDGDDPYWVLDSITHWKPPFLDDFPIKKNSIDRGFSQYISHWISMNINYILKLMDS